MPRDYSFIVTQDTGENTGDFEPLAPNIFLEAEEDETEEDDIDSDGDDDDDISEEEEDEF